MRPSKILPIIGLLLFAFIIARSGPMKILGVLMNIDMFYLLVSIGMIILVTILKSPKWKMVIGLHGCDYPFSKSMKVWLIGAFTGIVTPGRVGDLIRALYLNRECKTFGKCISTVIVDRVIELLMTLVFAAVGVVLFIFWFGQSLFFDVIIVFILLGFVLIGLMLRKNFIRRIMRPIFNFFVPKRHGDKIRVGFHEFYGSIREIRKKSSGLAYVSIFSLFIWLIQILEVQVFALTLGIEIGYLYVLVVFSIVVIVELIPISVSGIGTRDAFMVFSLGLIGISPEAAIAFSILYLVLGYWINALVGFFFWMRDPIRLNR